MVCRGDRLSLAVGQPTNQDDVVWGRLTQLYTIHAKGRFLLDLQARICKYRALTAALGFVRAVECESLRRRRLQDNGQLSKAGGLSITPQYSSLSHSGFA